MSFKYTIYRNNIYKNRLNTTENKNINKAVDLIIEDYKKYLIMDAEYSKGLKLENLHYPIDTDKYIGRYNNLNNSVMTVDIKLGNCEDFSVLLSELLVSQGISARRVYGYFPKVLNERYNTLDDYGRHMLVEVYDGDKCIPLESTLFDADNLIDFEIYGNTIKVARGLKIDSVKVQPFLPEGMCTYQSTYQSSYPPGAPGVDLIDVDFIPMYK